MYVQQMVKSQPTRDRQRMDASGQTQRCWSASHAQGAWCANPPAARGARHSASPSAPGVQELSTSGCTYMCEELPDQMPLS